MAIPFPSSLQYMSGLLNSNRHSCIFCYRMHFYTCIFPPFCSLLWSWAFYYNTFRVPSSSGIPHHVFLVSFKILLFYPQPYSRLTLLSYTALLTHKSLFSTDLSPAVQLLIWIFQSQCKSRCSPFLPCPLLSGCQYKSCTKTYLERMSELQVNIRKLWNMKIKISSTSNHKPLHKREEKRHFNNSSVGKVVQILS